MNYLIIGHVCLQKDVGSATQQLVLLVDALSGHDLHQHVSVRSPALAEKLSTYSNVTVGPLVRSAVTAYCLLPPIDIAHVHDLKSAPSGLLLTLTRSIPFVITHRESSPPPDRTIAQSAYRRAAAIVCPAIESKTLLREVFPDVLVDTIQDSDIEQHSEKRKMAAEYLRIYRRSLDNRGIPSMLI